jgi:hypothetical protein
MWLIQYLKNSNIKLIEKANIQLSNHSNENEIQKYKNIIFMVYVHKTEFV